MLSTYNTKLIGGGSGWGKVVFSDPYANGSLSYAVCTDTRLKTIPFICKQLGFFSGVSDYGYEHATVNQTRAVLISCNGNVTDLKSCSAIWQNNSDCYLAVFCYEMSEGKT